MNELQRVYYEAAPLHGSVLAALEAVARHVLSDPGTWRERLGMELHTPTVLCTECGAVIGMGAITLQPASWFMLCEQCLRSRSGSYHHLTEARPAYDPARSVLEQRLDLASLSRAEGQE